MMMHTAKADAAAVEELLRLPAGANLTMRQMLADGLPHLLPAKGEPRHAVQEQFAGLVRSAILELKQTAIERHAAFQSSIQTSNEEVEVSRKAEEVAAREEEAASAVVQEKSQRLAACRAALEKTKEECAVADVARDNFLEPLNNLETEKSEISSLLEGPLRMLLEGGWEDEDIRDTVICAVTKLLGGIQADPALVAAAPKALAVRPANRAAFDELTTASVVDVLRERVSSIDEQLQAKAHECEDLKDEALGLCALSEWEGEEEKAACAELVKAKDLLRRATRAREEAGANFERRRESLSEQLSMQVLEEEKAKQIDAALEAAERLAEFEYETAQRVADVSGDASMAVEDVEMADSTPDKEESLIATLPSKANMDVPSGNPFGVPTPMFA